MFRARRLASAIAVAAVAVTGLSACRSAPDVAAYLDSGNISAAEVQRIYDDAKSKADTAATPGPAGADPAATKFSLTSGDILDTLVSHDVLTKLAQKHSVAAPTATAAQLNAYATLLKLPPTAEYVQKYVDVDLYQIALNRAGSGGALTEAEWADVLKRLKAGQLVDPTATTQQLESGLSADAKKILGSAIALKKEAGTELTAEHARVNPRYGNLEIPIYTNRDSQTGAGTVLVALPVTDAGSQVPVTDAP